MTPFGTNRVAWEHYRRERNDLMQDYRTLGFVDNPFLDLEGDNDSQWWARIIVQALTNRLASTLEADLAAERPRPVLVLASPDLPPYYVRAAENAYLARSALDEVTNVFAVNIPLKRMKEGRVRGTLTELVELVAADDFDLTLGRFLQAQLTEPDPEIPGFDDIAPEVFEHFISSLAVDPGEAVTTLFEDFRGGDVDPTAEELAVAAASIRGSRQEADPDESDDTPEVAPGTGESSVADSYQQRADVAEAEALAQAGEEGGGEQEEALPAGPSDEQLLVDYLAHYLRVHLSPVLARGVRSYAHYGADALAQELKVTSAPKKTMKGLFSLMSYRWSNLVLIYDGFEIWGALDEETRGLVVTALTEMRWALGSSGAMVFILTKDAVPEVEEQFGVSAPVEWTALGIEPFQAGNTELDMSLVQSWLDAAALATEGSAVKADGPELAPLVEAAGGETKRFAEMAAVAFEDAARRGLATLDEQAVQVGLVAPEITFDDE